MAEIENKIDKIITLTDSQKDRALLQESSTNNLLNFLNYFIDSMKSKNDLQEAVDKLISDKIQKEIEVEGIDGLNWGVIFKLKELTGKQQVDSAIPILKILESAVKQPESPLKSKPLEEELEEVDSKITVEEYKSVKKLLKIIDDLSDTEFNEQEKK